MPPDPPVPAHGRLAALFRPRLGRPVLGYVLLVIAACSICGLPVNRVLDADVRMNSLDRLLADGKLELIRYSLIGPLVSSPLWFLGRWVGETDGCVLMFNRVLFLAALAALWGVLRGVLEERERVRFLVVLAVASMIPHYLMTYMGEVFTAMTVAVGTAAVVARRAWWGWPLAVLGAANTAATIPALGCAAAVLCWHDRRLRHLLAVAAAVGLVFAENYLRRGDPIDVGYKGDRNIYPTILPYSAIGGFGYPLFFGVLSVLFSFGKGLVFFMPALFLPYPPEGRGPAADDRARLLYRMWVAFVVGLVLVYSRWWCWSGSWCWGPRFFLFGCLPAALVLARWTARPPSPHLAVNLLVVAVVALSAWVGTTGVVFSDTGIIPLLASDLRVDFVTFYVPECSALWWPFTYPFDPLGPADWLRLGLGAAAGLYLAGPHLAAAGRQLRAAAAAVWAGYRTGPRFRF
jgi:hypothetical protein